MGCDIHFHVERKIGGQWVSPEKWYKDPDSGTLTLYDWVPGTFVRKSGPMYSSRNYDLFAMLADVRNSGYYNAERINPIFPPRGMPGDESREVGLSAEQWGPDGHSHTWITVRELMEYDWTQTMVKKGVVGVKEYIRFKLGDKPRGWSVATNERLISNSEMDEIVGENPTWSNFHEADDNFFSGPQTRIEWKVKYSEMVK